MWLSTACLVYYLQLFDILAHEATTELVPRGELFPPKQKKKKEKKRREEKKLAKNIAPRYRDRYTARGRVS